MPPVRSLRVGGVLVTSIASFLPFAPQALRLSWWAGEDVKGGRIGEYAPSTKKRKAAKGLPTTRVVLIETGRLYASVHVELAQREYIFRSDVPYLKYIIERYGERVMGVGPTGKKAFREAVRAYLVQNLPTIWLRVA